MSIVSIFLWKVFKDKHSTFDIWTASCYERHINSLPTHMNGFLWSLHFTPVRVPVETFMKLQKLKNLLIFHMQKWHSFYWKYFVQANKWYCEVWLTFTHLICQLFLWIVWGSELPDNLSLTNIYLLFWSKTSTPCKLL